MFFKFSFQVCIFLGNLHQHVAELSELMHIHNQNTDAPVLSEIHFTWHSHAYKAYIRRNRSPWRQFIRMANISL